MIALDPLVVWMAAAALAALFAHAALAKLADRDLFSRHLAAYRLPSGLATLALWGLPLAEAAAAVALLGPWRQAGAALAAALLLLYGSAMAWHRAHGRRLDCGCGGEPLPLSWALVARNVLLAALAWPAAAPTATRPIALADVGLIAAALALGTLLLAVLHQVLRHQAGLDARGLSRPR